MPGSPIASAWVELIPSAAGFDSKLRGILGDAGDAAGSEGGKRASAGIVGGLKSIAAPIAGIFAGIGIGKILGDSISSAANLEQSVGAIDAVFKGSAGQMHAWADTAATSVGLTKNEYNELGTLIGAQLKNGGTSMDELGGKTNDLIGVGADLSSMFGGTTKEAVDALSSALKGERDPIERYGVSLNQAAIDAKAAELGFSKVGGTLSQSANQAATIALIMEQTGDAAGNFGREADTLSHKQQVLNAMWSDGKAAIGTALLPAVSAAAGALIGVLGPALDGTVTGLNFLVDAVGPVMSTVASSIGGLFAGVDFSGFGSTLAPIAASAIELWQAFSPLSLVFQAIGPQIPALASALGGLAVVVGAALTQALTTLIPALTPLVSALSTGLAGALTGLLPMITSLATFLTDNIGPVLALGAAIAGGVLAFQAYQGILAIAKTATIAYAAVQTALNLVMSANPISLIVIALGALVAGIIWVATQTTFFQDVWAAFSSFFAGAMQNILTVSGDILTGIGSFFTDTWNNIVSFVTGAIGVLIDLFLNWTPLGIIISNFEPIVAFFADFFANTGGMFAGFFTNTFGMVTDFVTNTIGMFTDFVSNTVGMFVDFFTNLGTKYVDFFGAVVGFLTAFVVGSIQIYNDFTANTIGMFVDFFSNTVGMFVDFFNNTIGMLTDFGSNLTTGFRIMWEQASSFVSDGVNNVIGFIAGLPDQALSALGDLGNLLTSSGRDLIQSFIDGISGMLGAVGDAVGGIMDFAGGFFPHSPAKRGQFAGAGWRAIEASGGAILDAFNAGFDPSKVSGLNDLGVNLGGKVNIPRAPQFDASATATSAARGTTITQQIYGQEGMSAAEIAAVARNELNYAMRRA